MARSLLKHDELKNLTAAATEAVRRAGDFLKGSRIFGAVPTMEAARDVKLVADCEAEDIIITALQKTCPLPILSEERGDLKSPNREKRGGLLWIVDPLDGSFNYLRGIPLCCISIGLWEDNVPLLGVIYDFAGEELFSGIVGQGAWLNGKPVQVSTTGDIGKAALCSGFPVGTDFSSLALLGFVEQIQRYRKVRLLGSAALSLAYVSAGRADCYYEQDIKIWDVAAGLAIVRAAGGQTLWTKTNPLHELSVYAGNALLEMPDL